VAQAHLLTSIALASYWLTEYDEARRTADSALRLVGTNAPATEAVRVRNTLGLITWQQGQLAVADSFFRAALRMATAAYDSSGMAKAAGNLALVLTDYGEFAEAHSALSTARDVAHAVGNTRVEGNAYTNLAMLAMRTGDLPDAEQDAQHALQIYRSTQYETGAQNALGQLATIEAAKGDGQAAFAAIDSALPIVRRHGLKEEEASDLAILAGLYADAGDLHSASLYYDDAERQFTASGNELESANLMRARASMDAAHGDTAMARKHVAAALALHQKFGARAEELNDRLTTMDLAGAGDAASENELDSLALFAGSLGNRAAEARTALTRARYEERRGQPREVLRVLSSDMLNPRQLDHTSLWQAAALRLRAFARLGQLDSAEIAGREAVRLTERSRGLYRSAELRTAYTARMAQVYTDLVLVLLRKGNVSRAFEIADAARGRAFVEHLSSARTQLGGNTTPALFLDAELLASRIDSLVARMEASDRRRATERRVVDNGERLDLTERLARARSEYESQMARAQSADDAQLLGLTTLDASSIQASLAPDEALLDYLLTQDTLLTFFVTRDRVTVVRAAAREQDVTARARVVRDLFGTHAAAANGTPASQALFELLITPAVNSGALTNAHRLMIVPHEGLSYVPFAALSNPRTGRALVEEYTLAYLPSASALPSLRTREHVVQQSASRPVALAPFTNTLPATAAAVRRFAARVPNADVHSGNDATEKELRAALASGGIVHVATHAELNLRNPMFSEIRLAPGTGALDDDGHLEAYEIFGMRVRSPLVFLSGCETGAGSAWSTDFQRGEDYATLARAFLFAGAENVIATLWPIDDEGAAAFADLFYLYRHDTDVAEALARAQRQMMRNPRYRSPYYWAGYQLSGAAK
jgi:CHAT domain-containing protein